MFDFAQNRSVFILSKKFLIENKIIWLVLKSFFTHTFTILKVFFNVEKVLIEHVNY